MMRKALLLLFISIQLVCARAQINFFEDEKLMDSIEVCIDNIYNYQFNTAEAQIKYISSQTKNHPLNPFLSGLLYYWNDFPLTPEKQGVQNFVDSLEVCIDLSKEILEEDPENSEISLLNLTSHALLMMYYADNGFYRKAIEHVYPGYRLAMKSFQFADENPEFKYYTGLYNYYREEYPKAPPLYKPVVYFLRDGNPKKGIEELSYTANNCVIMDTEAHVFLVIIYLFYENNADKALEYAEAVYNLHPNNNFFLSRYIELLLQTYNYEAADSMIQELFSRSVSDEYAKMNAYVFKGVLEEKHNKNYNIALYDYKKGLKLSKNFETYSDAIKTYAYLGLSRIYHKREKKDLAEKYFEMAQETADYEYYFNEEKQ